jgi:hypothetical protein
MMGRYRGVNIVRITGGVGAPFLNIIGWDRSVYISSIIGRDTVLYIFSIIRREMGVNMARIRGSVL